MTESTQTPCSCGTNAERSSCGCTQAAAAPAAVRETTSTITTTNRLDHFLARWGVNRNGHRVEPGLYRLGHPDAASPVFASANYTLSFDALRSALAGTDGWILVLDTNGINVWCAAGKGTFGTAGLVRQIESTGLAGIVSHRTVIVPQLGAPGMAWPDVVRRTGFTVEYGPVRARDLPEYLKTRTATPAMRRVEFPLADRIALIPVELVHVALPAAIVAIVLWFPAGPPAALAAIAAVVAGTVLFPVLLPFIPTRDFSTKGLILGGIVAVPFAGFWATAPALPLWAKVVAGIVPLLVMPAVTAYLALNFTGSTTFTSRTGVKKEIFRYVPVMALMAGAGTVLAILLGLGRLAGVL
jgi:hypothetical protein